MGQIPTDVEPYLTRLVRSVAAGLIRGPGFHPQDVHDLEQDLHADMLDRWSSFDASKSSPRTFADRVVRHRASRLIQYQFAQCRNPFRIAGSVEQLEDAADSQRRVGTVRDYLRATGSDVSASVALQIDLEKAMELLPPEVREVCYLRGSGLTIREVATEANISPRTVNRAISSARNRLRDLGLDDYLK